ncbi:MAG: hypothetical protein NVSMB57_03450 [Actinomycetota bacterium]
MEPSDITPPPANAPIARRYSITHAPGRRFVCCALDEALERAPYRMDDNIRGSGELRPRNVNDAPAAGCQFVCTNSVVFERRAARVPRISICFDRETLLWKREINPCHELVAVSNLELRHRGRKAVRL